MTVMAQMKATVDKNTNTQEYLGKLYNSIKGKILLENIITKEDEKAQKLEDFLRFIKSVQNNKGIVDQNSAFSKFCQFVYSIFLKKCMILFYKVCK